MKSQTNRLLLLVIIELCLSYFVVIPHFWSIPFGSTKREGRGGGGEGVLHFGSLKKKIQDKQTNSTDLEIIEII